MFLSFRGGLYTRLDGPKMCVILLFMFFLDYPVVCRAVIVDESLHTATADRSSKQSVTKLDFLSVLWRNLTLSNTIISSCVHQYWWWWAQVSFPVTVTDRHKLLLSTIGPSMWLCRRTSCLRFRVGLTWWVPRCQSIIRDPPLYGILGLRR